MRSERCPLCKMSKGDLMSLPDSFVTSGHYKPASWEEGVSPGLVRAEVGAETVFPLIYESSKCSADRMP